MVRAKILAQFIRWEWALEYRRSNGWFLPVLFAAMVGYLVSLLVRQPNPVQWLSLLWITLVFSALQTATRSFSASPSEWLYLNQLARPSELLLGKSITTALNTVFVAWTSVFLFGLWLGWPRPEGLDAFPIWTFLTSITLGAVAMSTTLSFTAALSSKLSRNTGVMAILSLPLLLPTLLVAMRSSKLALLGEPWTVLYPNWLGELALSALPLALGALLFPYLWRS